MNSKSAYLVWTPTDIGEYSGLYSSKYSIIILQPEAHSSCSFKLLEKCITNNLTQYILKFVVYFMSYSLIASLTNLLEVSFIKRFVLSVEHLSVSVLFEPSN